MPATQKPKGVKVRESSPPAKTKGHRQDELGPVRTNAKDPGFPHVEAPWPKAKRKNL